MCIRDRVLLTGRGSSSEWHTRSRTGKSAVLRSLSPQEPYAELSPADAAALGIASGDDIVIESARGAMAAKALVTSAIAPGHVFVPMHYAGTNQLTYPSFDPHSRQPSYKHGAVRVHRPESWTPRIQAGAAR